MKSHKQMIINYLPQVEDPMAASMLQCLLKDISQLEEQLDRQNTRMTSFHTNLQRYSQNVIQQIVVPAHSC